MFALLLVVRSGLSLQQLVELVCVLTPILRKRKKLKRISPSQSINIGKALRDWKKNGYTCFAFLPQPRHWVKSGMQVLWDGFHLAQRVTHTSTYTLWKLFTHKDLTGTLPVPPVRNILFRAIKTRCHSLFLSTQKFLLFLKQSKPKNIPISRWPLLQRTYGTWEKTGNLGPRQSLPTDRQMRSIECLI